MRPIVYYVDPATPERWVEAVKRGVENWQPVFETAGFRNAIVARDPPSRDEDPNWDPEDVRYSVVRWAASLTRNAQGPRTSDPRTGEIIESGIVWYHNHMRSYRNWMMVQTGAANPDARHLPISDELMFGEPMGQWQRYVGHVITVVGGVHVDLKTEDQAGPVYDGLPRQRQKEAMAWLSRELFEAPTWLNDPAILERIGPSAGGFARLSSRQAAMLSRLLDPRRMAMLAELETTDTDPYSLLEYLMTEQPSSNPFQGPAPDMTRSEIRPLVRAQLTAIHEDAERGAGRVSDRATRAHLEDVQARIDRILGKNE